MTIVIIVLHVIVCIGLIGIVLIQRGRGSGLVESFSRVESMFGTKTSLFLTRATTVFSIIFFFTCLSLAVLSVRQSKSLIREVKPQAAPITQAPTIPQAPEKAQPAPSPQTAPQQTPTAQ